MATRGRAQRRSVELLFAGRWIESGFGAPMMWPGDRVQAARRALDEASLWPCPDPRHLAAELRFKICACDLRGCGGETTDGETIFYRRHPDHREQGLLLAHGLAHALLMREGWAHSEADAWWLTADLVMGGALASMGLEQAVTEAHAPEWFVRAFASVARREVAPIWSQIRTSR